jgi:hypothetical protein
LQEISLEKITILNCYRSGLLEEEDLPRQNYPAAADRQHRGHPEAADRQRLVEEA